MDNFLQIQGLNCGYDDKFRLQNVSFNLQKGILAGVIGPNGSGKTTLFKGLTGELAVNKNNVKLNNLFVPAMPLKQKARNIAVVTQTIDPVDIAVEDYVLLGRCRTKKLSVFETRGDREIARKYMQLTGIWPKRHKFMARLSGGEQQLAGIARALAQQPQLLLLDEPTSHLDITHQVQVLNLIQQLNHELKLTVLMIIHDLNLAGEYCDYLVMLNEGRVFATGTPAHVLNYQNIEDVYKTVVITKTNPLSKKPAVFLVSKKVLDSMAIPGAGHYVPNDK
ncbi:MAG: ABC transporter ATP-binding protein [Bacteroidales bacterium]|nr:ABC transporter ATP-binding protein [Bacteroidales bacterium]